MVSDVDTAEPPAGVLIIISEIPAISLNTKAFMHYEKYSPLKQIKNIFDL